MQLIPSIEGILKKLFPQELQSCFRASFQKEDTFISSIPYLNERAATKFIEKKSLKMITSIEKKPKYDVSLLPDDTFILIFSYLDCKTLISLSQVKFPKSNNRYHIYSIIYHMTMLYGNLIMK